MLDLQAPPHSIDAEQALIGAVLLRPEVLADIELSADAFYGRNHKLLWQSVLDLNTARQPIDAISLSDAMHSAGTLDQAGGVEYLGMLATNIHSAVNAGHYAEIVRGKAVERKLAALGHELARIGYAEGQTQAKVDEAQALISEFSEGLQVGQGDQMHSLDEAMRETISKLQAQWSAPSGLLGLSTGLADLDARTQGLRRGDMIVIAGRPSQGKTALAMNIAENVALNGGFVIVFCMDMPREALMTRMLASIAKVDHTRLENGQLADDEFTRVSGAGARVKGRHLFISDRTNLTSGQLLSRARRIAHKIGRKPDLVVVDYLQQLQDKGEGNERVTTISRNMKSLARELDCPALILSQLNRGVEGRGDKRPLMSDLRDSGSIEQDADIIFMMYRDEYYDEDSPQKGLAEVICRKYRNGKIGTDILDSSHLNQCRFANSTVHHIAKVATQKKRGGFEY